MNTELLLVINIFEFVKTAKKNIPQKHTENIFD